MAFYSRPAMPNIGGTYLNMGTDAHYFESAYYYTASYNRRSDGKTGFDGQPRWLRFLVTSLERRMWFQRK